MITNVFYNVYNIISLFKLFFCFSELKLYNIILYSSILMTRSDPSNTSLHGYINILISTGIHDAMMFLQRFIDKRNNHSYRLYSLWGRGVLKLLWILFATEIKSNLIYLAQYVYQYVHCTCTLTHIKKYIVIMYSSIYSLETCGFFFNCFC